MDFGFLHGLVSAHVVLQTALILILWFSGKRYLHATVEHILALISAAGASALLAEHRETARGVARLAARVALYAALLLLTLDLFGINIVPLLVAGGFAGIIGGLILNTAVQFHLKELLAMSVNRGRYKVGDHVEINGSDSGTVEHIGLMLVTLRAPDGAPITMYHSAVVKVRHTPRGGDAT